MKSVIEESQRVILADGSIAVVRELLDDRETIIVRIVQEQRARPVSDRLVLARSVMPIG